jgi:DNA-binding CsgD family transcriptional regulator
MAVGASSFVATAIVTTTCGPVVLDSGVSIPLFLAGAFALIVIGTFIISHILRIRGKYGQRRDTLFILAAGSLPGLASASVFLYLTIDLAFARPLASVLLSIMLILLNFGLITSNNSTVDRSVGQKTRAHRDPYNREKSDASSGALPDIETIISPDRIVYLGKQYHLTPREVEIFKLLIQGHSPQELSGMLFISLSTTRSHIKSIYSKTDVHSQLELIRKFMWLPPQC